MRALRPVAAMMVSGVGLWGLEANVYAQTSFTPIVCPTCPSWTAPVSYVFDSDSGENGVEPDKDNALLTARNQRSRRLFWANAFVRGIQFYFTSFDTEGIVDRLELSQDDGPRTTAFGVFSNSHRSVTTPLGLQWAPVTMTYVTDATVASNGFATGHVDLCCQPMTDAPWPRDYLVSGMRNEGVLLGTNDVVYFKFPAAPTGSPTRLVNIVLTGQAATGFNPNLYVRCGALPTPTTFTEASLSADRLEFAQITTNECAAPSDLWIAVHSQAGAGTFSLHAAQGLRPQAIVYRVVVETDSIAEFNSVEQPLRELSRKYFALTEGQFLLDQFIVTRVPIGTLGPQDHSECFDLGECSLVLPGGNCMCMLQECNFTSHESGWGVIMVSHGPNATMNCNGGPPLGDWGDSDVLLHEVAHQQINQTDEYGTCGARCGHTTMGYSQHPAHNMCVGGTNANHPKDRDPTCTSGAPNPAGWDRAT